MTAFPATSAQSPGTLVPSNIVGGVGGTLFVLTVVAQNIIRSKMPANDASTQHIIDFYAEHHRQSAVLAVLFAIGAIGLALFSGGLLARLVPGHARGPAFGGLVGVGGVVALFSTTVAIDSALSAYVNRGAPADDVVTGLWLLHAASFGVLTIFIGLALAGLSAAAAEARLVPTVWKPIGLVAGVLAAASGALTPAIVEGSKALALGLVGFIAWLAFVVNASIGLLRTTTADDHS
jgi:hypothetical protein